MLSGIAAALLGATACSADSDALTIYSGREEELVGPLLDRFASETGTDIEVRYGDSADLALLIANEGDESPADVFLSQSPGTVGFLDAKGMLAPLPDADLESVDERFSSEDGRWLGLTARQRVLVYNTELVTETDLPDSVFDLTEPSYRGRIALAPTNASFQDFIAAMRQLEGDDAARDWLEGMVANESPTYADNLSIVDAVARGEVPMGLVNHYYNYRYRDENPDSPTSNYRFPGNDAGALLIASTASVVAVSDRSDKARDFIDFLVSDDSAEYFAKQTFEYPLAEGAEADPQLPPLDSLHFPEVDIDRLGGGLEQTTRMISDSGLL